MRKILFALLIGLFLIPVLPAPVSYAEDVVYQDNVGDKMSDWAATLGKDKTERDKIVAERKAERQKRHLEKKAKQAQKKAEKEAQKAGKEAKAAGKGMQKKLGL
ncbi:MAG: hypothetical protein ACOY3K_00240 [Candidatus Omnitrophota bacterium]